MKTGRTLQPEDRISHYRIVGPLGAGGMGEVYLAQDSNLDRSVAVKILPHEVVRSEERVRRFVLEAKSASSLNHPNIVTIYEIGQDVVRTRENQVADPDSGPVHFISMELITGETLGNKIHQEKTDLRTLLGYLAQVAEGIAKAHAAGIVHRDLKPGNIMISKDGFAKVLDFGLAKLTEKQERGPDLTSAPTMDQRATNPGMVIGTVGYMSPEQVQGKAADPRSDIFSFGCILYEAATRQRPFVAESDVETMHKIVHEKPAPVEEFNLEAPAELRRIIRRCLAKSPEQRFQSMKDLAIELREIVEEYDALSRSATAGSSMSGASTMAPVGRRRVPVPVLVAGAVIGVGAIVFAVWALRRGDGGEAARGFRTMRVSSQTNAGNVVAAALSKDGRFLAYITRTEGQAGLRVRQVATGTDRDVLRTEAAELDGPSFSPDGNYLYYVRHKEDAPHYLALHRVPSLGGSPEEIAFDVDTRVSFSPDGKECVFLRFVPEDRKWTLVVLNLDTRVERELAAVRRPEQFFGGPAWSPDGKRVAAPLFSSSPAASGAIGLWEVVSGRRQTLSLKGRLIPFHLDWLSDGRALVMSAQDRSIGRTTQIFLVEVPGGDIAPITNDAFNYGAVTVSADDQSVATVRIIRFANLWVSGGPGLAPRQITTITNPENSPWGFTPAENDRVLYIAPGDAGPRLWSHPVAGGEPRQFATGSDLVFQPLVGAGIVAFQRVGGESPAHIWRANQDGTGSRQLTHGAGERLLDVSRDGRFATIVYSDSARGVWLLPLDGGAATLLSETAYPVAGWFSPDGRHVLLSEPGVATGGLIHDRWQVVPVAGGAPVADFSLPPRAENARWAPDGEALTYVDRADSLGNVYRLPFSGGTPEAVTRFREGRVTDYRWSPDGTRLAVARSLGTEENVWVTAANGSNPERVTSYTTEEVFSLAWMPDNRRVVVRAGTESRDAVLIRNFR